jgi:lactoylglutathione lyase
MEVWQMRVVIRVDDVERAVRFYRDALGLRLVERWEQPPAPGAIFDTGRGQIQVYQPAADADDTAPAPPTIMLITGNVDQEYARLTSVGVPALWGPATTGWGTRQFAVQAPDGTTLVFCAPAPPTVDMRPARTR